MNIVFKSLACFRQEEKQSIWLEMALKGRNFEAIFVHGLVPPEISVGRLQTTLHGAFFYIPFAVKYVNWRHRNLEGYENIFTESYG